MNKPLRKAEGGRRNKQVRNPQSAIPSQLAEDEQMVLHQQGGYLSGRSWKLGHLHLTDKRLLFSQAGRLALDLPLSNVTGLGFQQRSFLLATKTCLRLSYRNGSGGRQREATIITGDLAAWTQRLAEVLTSLGVDFEGPENPADDDAAPKKRVDSNRRIGLEDLERVAAALDPASAELIWYLWEHRQAKIEELRQMVGAPSHMHVLARIRETINPVARRILGQPLLIFESRRTDPWTGEVVPYSWWLCPEAERRPKIAPPADVFDEGAQVVVVMELAGVEEDDIQMQAEGEWLMVTAGDRPAWEISLPAAVDGKRISSRYHNNVLQVKLEKKSRET